MRERYPTRFRIRGSIELSYNDYSTVTTTGEKRIEGERTGFEQRYKLGIQGFILHPRLALYSTDVIFRDSRYKVKRIAQEGKERDISYNLFLRFLPQRPINLDLYASRTTGTVWGGTLPYDNTSNSYGIELRLSLKDLRFLRQNNRQNNRKRTNNSGAIFRGLPYLRFSYDHWDYDSEREHGKRESDRYGLNIKGALESIRTNYILGYEWSDYTSPLGSYTSQHINIRADTNILIKKGNVLLTSFQYSDSEISKLLNFTAELVLSPIGRFSHGYDYQYGSSEIDSVKTEYHNIHGSWEYRFRHRFFVGGNAYYNLATRDGESEDSYGASVGVTYGRPLKGLDLTSRYRLSYRETKKGGELIENSLYLGLETRKLKWGMIYTNYSLTYLTSDEGDVISHRAGAGIRGRGPGRAYWNVGAEFYSSHDERGRSGIVLTGGPGGLRTPGALESRYYSLSGDVGYPLGRRGLVALKSGYTIGEADLSDIERFHYEARLNYRIFRNLSFMAWWREAWDTIEDRNYDKKLRDYEIRLDYRLRMVFLSLEYKVTKTEESVLITETKYLYLKLWRPIAF